VNQTKPLILSTLCVSKLLLVHCIFYIETKEKSSGVSAFSNVRECGSWSEFRAESCAKGGIESVTWLIAPSGTRGQSALAPMHICTLITDLGHETFMDWN
jgi:hypothetical protein